MDQFEKGKGEKVEEGKDELNEEKRKLPGLVGEVYAIIHIQIFSYASSSTLHPRQRVSG